MEIVDCLELDWVAKKVVNQGLYGWVLEKMFLVDNETVVDVSVIGKVKVCVLEEVVVYLMPRVFDEGNGNVAEGRRELGANPSSSDLLVGVVACPENTGVECKGDTGGDV